MCRAGQGPQPRSPDKERNGICRRPGSWRNSISDSVPYQLASGFAFHGRCTSARQPVREFLSHCEACKEHHGPALSRPPPFLPPPSLGNILPSVGVLFPHSHTRHQVSKSQPTLEELPLRGEVALGPGNLGLRLSFRQIWKRHFTSFSLSTLYIRRNRNSCSPTCPTA